MAASLPSRRPRPVPDRDTSGSKGAVLAIAVTASVLAAFAVGVLVGRNQAGSSPQAAAPDSAAPIAAPAGADAATGDGPAIEMIRPDGSNGNGAGSEAAAPAQPKAAPAADRKAAAPEAPAAQPNEPAPAPAKAAAPAPAATPEPSPAQPRAQTGGMYTVQVAAFRDRESADRLSLELESRGYDAYVQRSNVDGKGLWYRVRIGSYQDKASARDLAARLETKEGRSAYVTIR